MALSREGTTLTAVKLAAGEGYRHSARIVAMLVRPVGPQLQRRLVRPGGGELRRYILHQIREEAGNLGPASY